MSKQQKIGLDLSTLHIVFCDFLNHNLEWFGGEEGICQYERMRIFVVSRGLALHIANDYRVQMMMLITIVNAIHHPPFDKEKIPKYRDFWREDRYPILTPKSIFVAGGLKSV